MLDSQLLPLGAPPLATYLLAVGLSLAPCHQAATAQQEHACQEHAVAPVSGKEALQPVSQPIVHYLKSCQASQLSECLFVRASVLLSSRAGGGMGHGLDSGRQNFFSLLLQQLPLDMVACRTAQPGGRS